MSGILLTESTVANALSTVTTLAAETITGSTGSGVTLTDAHGGRTTSAATDPLVERLDGLQYQLDEGPCLTAWREQTVIRSGSSDGEQRWPAWIERAHELGLRSYISAPLVTGDTAIGAIKVYSTAVDAFTEHQADLLQRFADHAAVFVGNVQTLRSADHLSAELKETLRTRDLIATARGVMMGQRGLSYDEAFRALAAEAQRTGQPLRDVAARIVNSSLEA
ncbi:hypothetical protein C6A85_92740 [Mycobacterium sp. ITM-2017-0098]|nr:hypothetical protein C6A85_92740 [Mycobacterium sp. ITM-2017-0098]